MDYEKYTATLESVGESILNWADPENQFRGHTNVREAVETESACYTSDARSYVVILVSNDKSANLLHLPFLSSGMVAYRFPNRVHYRVGLLSFRCVWFGHNALGCSCH
jgi:hypothetical protein